MRANLHSGTIVALLPPNRPMPGPKLSRPGAWRAASLRLVPLLALVLGGCPSPSRPPDGAALTLPVAPWLGTAYLQLAHQQGFDRAADIRMSLVPYRNPQEIVQAWLRGKVALAPLTSVEAVDLCSRLPQRCPVVVLVLDESRGGDQLIVHHSISDLRALRGRRVGVAPSSLGPFLTSRALVSVGLDIADVRLVPMDPQEMASALRQGRIDAAATYPPFSDLVLRLGIARVAFDSRALPGQILDVLVVDPQVLASQREDLARLVLAWQWTHGWARRQPGEAVRALAGLQGVSESALRRAQESLVIFPLTQQQGMLAPGGSVAATLAELQGVQQELGIVGPGAPLPGVSDVVVRRALQLGASVSAPK
jgi:NitT/TauT family transport system substrate-binding protein